jgi:hypothetical protein
MLLYFYDLSLDANDINDKEWYLVHSVYHRHFIFHNPSECLMFIPGTYAEMMKDYG